MARVDTQLVTHLDSANTYANYEREFDDRIYRRFIDVTPCLTHVQTYTHISETDLHFFLSHLNVDDIPNPINGFNDTRIHLYCHNQETFNRMRTLYRQRAIYKVFLENRLQFNLCQSQLELVNEFMQQSRIDSPERNRWVEVATILLDQMSNSFKDHMDAQLSVEAE